MFFNFGNVLLQVRWKSKTPVYRGHGYWMLAVQTCAGSPLEFLKVFGKLPAPINQLL